jgi:hypothetical protein
MKEYRIYNSQDYYIGTIWADRVDELEILPPDQKVTRFYTEVDGKEILVASLWNEGISWKRESKNAIHKTKVQNMR